MRRFWSLALGLVAACGGEPLEGPPERVAIAQSRITVDEAVDGGCSTSQVEGLSLQIIAQANCNNPGAYAELPMLADVNFGSAVLPYMQEPGRDALVSAIEGNPGQPMQINSMLRTVAQQYLLYRWYLSGTCGVALAASPGNSNHESGLAIDIQQYSAWQSPLEAAGFSWLGTSDPVHFDYTGPGAVSYDGEDVLAFQQLWNINNPGDQITEDGIYGPQTEGRLEQSPAEGFAMGADCGDPMTPPGDLMLDASFETATDRFDDGVSAGVVDLLVGETATLVVEVGGADVSDATLELTLPSSLELVAVDDEATSEDVIELGDLTEDATLMVEIELLATASNVDVEVPDPIELTVDGETIEVPVDVYEDRAWRFESSRLEGWSASGDAEPLETESGALVAVGEGMISVDSPELSIDATTVRRIHVRASRQGGDGQDDAGPATLWWTTEASPSFEASRSVDLDLPADGAMVDVNLEVTGSSGTFTGLRLVGFEDASAGAELRIDELSLAEDPLAPPGAESDEGCGCSVPGAPSDEDGGAPRWWALAGLVGAMALRRRARQRRDGKLVPA